MLHTFAKIGRSWWAQYALPACLGVGGSSYILLHAHGYPIIRKMLISQTYPGEYDKITPEVQQLILKAYEDSKSGLTSSNLGMEFFTFPDLQLKCFSSSTLDPSTWGVKDFKAGIILGIPNYFNYRSTSDIPSQFMEVKKLKFFKSKEEKATESSNKEASNIVPVDVDESKADQYKESMIISKEAKLFCIARELHYAATYRVPAKVFAFSTSAYLAYQLSRLSLQRIGNLRMHISVRLVHYSVMSLMGLLNFLLLNNSIESYYCRTADEDTLRLGEPYRQGAVEYIEHLIQRNKAMRSYIKGADRLIDEEGEVIRRFNWFSRKLCDRLESVKNWKPKEDNQ